MPKSRLWSLLVFGAAFALGVAGCSQDTQDGESGSLSLQLTIADDVEIDEVAWMITGGDMEPMEGTIDTSAPGATASFEVFGLPPTIGPDYTVTMEAVAEDEETTCKGSEDFGVDVGKATEIMVFLNCKRPQTRGGVRVNGEFNICAELAKVVVSPLRTSVGNDIDLSAIGQDVEEDEIEYLWTGTGGSVDDPKADETTYTCEEVGEQLITITVSDDDFDYCMHSWAVPVTCVEGDGLECTDDEDCDKDEVCNDDNVCVPDVECNDDEDCDEGEVCLENKCVPDLECTENADCDAGFVCEDFECVPDVECNENDDCDLGDICFENVCRADPDLFCDTGLCVEDTVLRAECVGKFFLCLADNVDEGECVLLSIAICTECDTGADCSDDNECTDNECTAGVCSNPNNDNMCDGGNGTCNEGVCETGEIPLPMVVDDNYTGRSAFGDGGPPLHMEDDQCPERAGDENGVCHRFTWDGTGGGFTGTFWTDGEGFVDLNGLAVEGGATEVSFYAWGADGGEVIEFGAGLGEPQWDGAAVRIFRTLTTTPTKYSVPLDNLAGYTDVFGPFIWAATSGSNPSGVEFYVDDIQWIQAPQVPLGPIDFEPAGLGAEFTWAVFENVDNPPLEFIANPDPSGANTSSTVAKFTARQAGQPFAGTITLDLPTFTLNASNSCVKIKVWKSVVSDVGIKFENATFGSTGEIKVANTVTDEWEELAFDFSGVIGPVNTDITGLVVFPDFDARTQENVIYFDDIVFLDSGQCP